MPITKHNKIRSKKIGAAPGTLIYTGERTTNHVQVSLFTLHDNEIKYSKDIDINNCFPLDNQSMHWINIDGIHSIEIVKKIGDFLSIHPLVLEDILNIGQRPKVEEFEKYLFIVTRVLHYNETQEVIVDDQASFILGTNFLISFFEKDLGITQPVIDRLMQGRGKTQRLGMDYLAYILIDAIVDQYFFVLDKIGDRIFSLENRVLNHPDNKILKEINQLKRDVVILRRTVWPLRETLAQLHRQENPLIDDETMLYYNDIYDHTIQLMDTIESLRDIIGGMIYVHMSTAATNMNDVIKILTIVSTIFAPLTFITSVYGMNFDYMPELHSHFGYLITWLVMILVGLLMVFFFWRKKWF